MTDPVPTTCLRCAVGCGYGTHGVDTGYGLDTVRDDVVHPVARGLACGRGINDTDPDERLEKPFVIVRDSCKTEAIEHADVVFRRRREASRRGRR